MAYIMLLGFGRSRPFALLPRLRAVLVRTSPRNRSYPSGPAPHRLRQHWISPRSCLAEFWSVYELSAAAAEHIEKWRRALPRCLVSTFSAASSNAV